ncbi:DUF4249 domain-containing protein [Tenacibaculum geojense]|uniref:DUF4249 domain-containing protein n=1 Tax=Tenacibaculum geojense TaxID=915352 RepID=A0ABW3JW65_9FLAO
MKISKILLIITAITFVKCIEPFEPESSTFEDLLVVEARLTNENKHHEIKLSRTYQIDTVKTNPETDAIIYIRDTNDNDYIFEEITDGNYRSVNQFSAEPDLSYQLVIITDNNKTYKSDFQNLPPTVTLNNINYDVSTNNFDEQVVNIYANSNNPNNNAYFYSYEYEETYKIIPPFWSPYKLDVTNPASPQIILKDYDDQICYKTQKSNSIIQIETKSLSNDQVSNFIIRSISINDFILTNRYSILVKQFVRNERAYLFFEKLNIFSESESVFTENQVGFINGNIKNIDNNEKVIGFFEASSVTEKRIFFNKEDINEYDIPFIYDCATISPLIYDPYSREYEVALAIERGYLFYEETTSTWDNGPFILVPEVCGDCRALGTTERPSFWID